MSTEDHFCVDNEYFRVYNRIKQKGRSIDNDPLLQQCSV